MKRFAIYSAAINNKRERHIDNVIVSKIIYVNFPRVVDPLMHLPMNLGSHFLAIKIITFTLKTKIHSIQCSMILV